MSLHDSLLSALQSVATVQLVASLRDARLNFGGDNVLNVFIPDVHLVSKKMRRKFKYGTNDTGLLTEALRAIGRLQQEVGAEQKTVDVFQMGDFLDLWRETSRESDRLDAATRIIDDHRRLMNALEALETSFLIGNHDFELHRRTNFELWERHYFLGNTAAPSGIALHGDVFDELEGALPNALQQLVVFHFSRGREPSDIEFKEVLALVHQENEKHDFEFAIGGDAHFGPLAAAEQGIPERHNVVAHKFLSQAMMMCQRANLQQGLSLRFAVIGHTHHARIAVHEQGNDFFTLIDTGAWIENCVLPDGTSMPNSQLTALSNNEVRIYQLSRRADV